MTASAATQHPAPGNGRVELPNREARRSIHPVLFSEVRTAIAGLGPGRILDLKAGVDSYGTTAAAYLDLVDQIKGATGESPSIDGVLSSGERLRAVQKFIYTNLYVGDAPDVVEFTSNPYDLAIIVGVLERHPFSAGMSMLDTALIKYRNVLVGLARRHTEVWSEAADPNHPGFFSWSPDHLETLGRCRRISTTNSHVCLLSR